MDSLLGDEFIKEMDSLLGNNSSSASSAEY